MKTKTFALDIYCYQSDAPDVDKMIKACGWKILDRTETTMPRELQHREIVVELSYSAEREL